MPDLGDCPTTTCSQAPPFGHTRRTLERVRASRATATTAADANAGTTMLEYSQTPDVVIFSQRWPPGVRRPSPGPVFHPESFFDGPGAGRGPPEAENIEKQPGAIFCVAWI